MAHETPRQPPHQAPAPNADDDDKPAAMAGETGKETEETKPEVPPPRPTVDEDDSEDELDELDDLLDDFETPSLPPPPPPPPKVVNTKNAGGKAPSAEAGTSPDDDFARQLQMGMADLLNEMGDSKELQDQFEHLVKELSDATNGPPPPASATASSSATVQIPQETVPKNFQDRIKQTMDRMHSSKAEVDSTLAENESEDFMAEMLKQLGASGEGGGEGDFSEMLLNVMEQLTSKEILYEPMKELNDKYPTWLEENKNKQTNEEMNRYKEQFRIVKEIVRKFEQAGYRDEDEGDREYIIERMQKMQAAGAPPPELMGEMGQGQGFPSDVDSNCGVQ